MSITIYDILSKRNISCPEELDLKQLGLSNSTKPGTLSFIDSDKYVDQLNSNENINAVISTFSLANKIERKKIILAEDPRWLFYTLQNDLSANKIKQESVIHPSSKIHPTAFIDPYNVHIGPGCTIGPNVSILEDVILTSNCIVGAGTVIGAEGFEHKRTTLGILSVIHDGKVIVGDKVEFGANNAISKGFSYRDTVIGAETKTDNLVHIAHCVQIGERCFLPAACVIAGSVTIENDVWIGPNACISSGLHIASNAFITLGSTVTKNVPENTKVTGYFAVEHEKFINGFKNSFKHQ